MAKRRPVTVVVPIYGDLESLLGCITALKSTVDVSTDSVLLVDDHGPDSQRIVAAVSAAIEDAHGFRLERNETNLGFVGTCNRAAFELDGSGNDLLFLNSDTVPTPGFLEELAEVLAASPTHGAVCARSNNATIASLPFRLVDPVVGRPAQRTQRVHDALVAELPRFSVSPVAMGFCLLVRRSLVDEYGLFDPVFAPGYGEENDFCLRIAKHGFVSVIAHRALVFHEGAKSFAGLRRDLLRARHERIVSLRYPGFRAGVANYLWAISDVADLFADVLVPREGDRAILVLARGRDRSIAALAEQLRSAPGLRVTVIRAGSSAARFLSAVFDAVLLSTDLPAADQAVADRSAPRWIVVPDGEAVGAEAVLDALATPVDIPALRKRHAAFVERGVVLPQPSAFRGIRQGAIDRVPVIVVPLEWFVLGVLRRLRSFLKR